VWPRLLFLKLSFEGEGDKEGDEEGDKEGEGDEGLGIGSGSAMRRGPVFSLVFAETSAVALLIEAQKKRRFRRSVAWRKNR